MKAVDALGKDDRRDKGTRWPSIWIQLLLDLLMPEMSGVEVLEHLRRDYPTLPVVIMSGNEDVEVARATLQAGAFDYLGKPFSITVLARVVAAAVARPD